MTVIADYIKVAHSVSDQGKACFRPGVAGGRAISQGPGRRLAFRQETEFAWTAESLPSTR